MVGTTVSVVESRVMLTTVLMIVVDVIFTVVLTIVVVHKFSTLISCVSNFLAILARQLFVLRPGVIRVMLARVCRSDKRCVFSGLSFYNDFGFGKIDFVADVIRLSIVERLVECLVCKYGLDCAILRRTLRR